MCFFSSILHSSFRIILCVQKDCSGVPITVQEWQCMIWTDKLVTLRLPWSSLQALFLCSTTISAVMHWSGVAEKLCTASPSSCPWEKGNANFVWSILSLCLLFFLPCFTKGVQPLETGSLLSSAQIMKVTLVFGVWLDQRVQPGCDEELGDLSSGTAEAGGGFCLWPLSAHCDGVCRDRANRYPEGVLTLILFCMLRVWMVVFWNCSHNLLIFASLNNQALIPRIFLLCACQGYQWRDGDSSMLGLYHYDPFLMASVFCTGFCALSDI